MDATQQIQAFLDYLSFEKRYSKHTVVAYKHDLKIFHEYILDKYETKKWEEVSQEIVRSWIAFLKSEKNESHKTIHRKISSIKSFYKFLLRKKWANHSPADSLVLPKISKRLPEFLKEDDVEKMLVHSKPMDENTKKEPSPKQLWRNRTAEFATKFFYETGIRLSELVDLKEKQIDFSYRQIKVFGKGSKERIIPLSDSLVKEIKEYIAAKPANQSENLFVNEKGEKLYTKFFYLAVKQQMTEGKVKLKKKSPHVLRHTFATQLMNNGADINAIKELLGHSSLAATQVYTHNTIEKLKEVYQKAHPKAK